MKKAMHYSLALIFVFAIYGSATAQLRKIPSEVTEAFHEKYPNAEKVEWKDKLTAFVAEFEMGNVKHEARFNKKGVWQETEYFIAEEDLPAEVKDGYEKSKYAEEWPVESVYKIELPSDKVQYRLYVVKSDLQKKNLLFNSKGRLLKDKVTL